MLNQSKYDWLEMTIIFTSPITYVLVVLAGIATIVRWCIDKSQIKNLWFWKFQLHKCSQEELERAEMWLTATLAMRLNRYHRWLISGMLEDTKKLLEELTERESDISS